MRAGLRPHPRGRRRAGLLALPAAALAARRPRSSCASISWATRRARRRSPTCSRRSARPGAPFTVVDASGAVVAERRGRAEPRALERALRRRPAARPEHADDAGNLPRRRRRAAGCDIAAVPHRQPRRALRTARRRRRLVLPGPARRRRRDRRARCTASPRTSTTAACAGTPGRATRAPTATPSSARR